MLRGLKITSQLWNVALWNKIIFQSEGLQFHCSCDCLHYDCLRKDKVLDKMTTVTASVVEVSLDPPTLAWGRVLAATWHEQTPWWTVHLWQYAGWPHWGRLRGPPCSWHGGRCRPGRRGAPTAWTGGRLPQVRLAPWRRASTVAAPCLHHDPAPRLQTKGCCKGTLYLFQIPLCSYAFSSLPSVLRLICTWLLPTMISTFSHRTTKWVERMRQHNIHNCIKFEMVAVIPAHKTRLLCTNLQGSCTSLLYHLVDIFIALIGWRKSVY